MQFCLLADKTLFTVHLATLTILRSRPTEPKFSLVIDRMSGDRFLVRVEFIFSVCSPKNHLRGLIFEALSLEI
jgi:hypothetical protein